MASNRTKLRSFTVTAQKTIGSDGCAARANYLYSETHENHVKSGTKIIAIHGKPEQVATNASLQWSTKNKEKYKNGGRPNHTYGMEYMLSPPKGYHLDKEAGKRLTKAVLTVVADKLDISPKELAKLSYSCVHSQENDHLNIWFATIDNDGNNLYRHGLSRPSVTNAIRREFNDFCLKEYGLNIDNFVPEKASLASKNWQRINDEKKIIDEEKKNFNIQKNELDKREFEIDKREFNLNEAKNELTKALPKQISKWLDYIGIGNLSRARTTEKRILKTLDKHSEYVEFDSLDELETKATLHDRPSFKEEIKKRKNKLKR